ISYCTACPGNDNGPGAGGMGPRGPHGSENDFLLERNLETADNTPESAAAYALCYKCHDRQNILDDRSFKKHKKHIENVEAPCTVCHDPHGVATQTHLINFDTRVVSPNAQGNLQFDDLGDRTGRCSLSCHNKQHNNQNY
ncbi:MAG: cytochrome c3 family protein, partial [Nitrospinota bacterium]